MSQISQKQIDQWNCLDPKDDPATKVVVSTEIVFGSTLNAARVKHNLEMTYFTLPASESESEADQ